jgi:hypothetical protein
MSTSRRLRCYRAPAIPMLLLPLAGCTKWTPVTPTPVGEFISEEEPRRLRIVSVDGRRVVVQNPIVRNDSIAEVREECSTSVAAGGRTVCQRTAVGIMALDEIALSEVDGSGAARSVGAAVGALLIIPALLTVIALVVLMSAEDPT